MLTLLTLPLSFTHRIREREADGFGCLIRYHFGSRTRLSKDFACAPHRSLKTNTISTTYPRTGYHQHYPRPIPGLDNYPSRIGKKLNIPTLVAELPYALRLSTFLGDLSQEPWKHSQAVYLSQATVTVEYALSQEYYTKELENIRAEYIKQARARHLRDSRRRRPQNPHTIHYLNSQCCQQQPQLQQHSNNTTRTNLQAGDPAHTHCANTAKTC